MNGSPLSGRLLPIQDISNGDGHFAGDKGFHDKSDIHFPGLFLVYHVIVRGAEDDGDVGTNPHGFV